MKPNWVAALAFDQRTEELKEEWPQIQQELGRLFLGPPPEKPLIWAQDYWSSLHYEKFDSVGEAVKILKKNSLRWVHLDSVEHRRSQLIQQQLKSWKPDPVEFLKPPVKKPFAVWTLLDKNSLIFCPQPSSPFPLGEFIFKENKEFPPTRAYLKLWEIFTFYLTPPSKKSIALDLGSCPGGWTWVLQSLGLKVVSVDKAPLAEPIQSLPRVEFIKSDAFRLNPTEVGPIDWLFSDLICAPDKLYDLVQKWKDFGVKNFVCTLKFKGPTDFKMIEKFREIPHSKMIHLLHNKHELTWILAESLV